MKRCIDTNAYTRMRVGHPRLQNLMEESHCLFVPVVVLGELYTGFCQGNRVEENEEALLTFLEKPGIRVQDITWDIARRYAYLMKTLKTSGTPIPTNDVWIASTALELGARLLTYDKHFEHVPGLITENP